ncbi:MAG: NrfD/PsrC family molybdoenzyme membrane anchor subunit [Bacillota bacterium]
MPGFFADKKSIAMLAMVIFGAIGAAAILIFGEGVMGTSDKVPWGALIAVYLFFAASSVGLTIMSSLWYVFKIPVFEQICKRALSWAIISIVLGFVAIGLELGNPLNMFWLVFSPNLNSAIWWMGMLYTIYLGLRIATVYNLCLQKDERVIFFGRLTLVAGIAAVSNLGAVFGYLHARPFWQGPFMSVHFLLIAFLSGTAILAAAFYLVEKKQGVSQSVLLNKLGKIHATTLVIILFITFWRIISNLYGQVPGKYEAVKALVAGPLAANFWLFEVGIGLIAPIILLVTASSHASGRIFKAAVLSLIGIFFMHYNMVIAGQLTPNTAVGPAGMPSYYAYFPSWAEAAVLVGTVGGAITAAMWVEKRFFQAKADAPAKGVAVDV